MKKRNIKLILLLQLIVLLVACFLNGAMCGLQGISYVKWFIDFASLLGILVVVIPGMLIMGTAKDFMKAFSVGKKHYRLLELKNILEAVDVCQKLVLFGGLVELLISLIVVLAKYFNEAPEAIGPNLAVVFLSGFYIIVLEYFLLPIKINVQKTMNEEMDLDEDE